MLFVFAWVINVSCYSVSERKNHAKGNIYQDKREAVLYRGQLWSATYDSNREVTNVFIPYTVKLGGWFSGLDYSDEETIKEAASVIAKHTCIRFVERKDEKDYIEFYEDSNNVCESYIGKKGGKQLLSLGSGCKNRGHVTHELMHALGFFHEHTRPDRDKFVKILWDNIKRDHDEQFKIRKRGVTTLGQPYDFQSIMHYSNKEFSKNNKDTIQALSDPNMLLGNVNSLSAVDVLQINLLYNCPEALRQVVNYEVTVYTGDKYLAGTDGQVFIELFGRNTVGQLQNSGEEELAGKNSAFEMRSVDRFNVISPNLGKLIKLTVRLTDRGYGGAWYLDKIQVQNRKRRVNVSFPCFCWFGGSSDTKILEPSS